MALLTKKRQAYARSRKTPPVFKGAVLRPNAAVSARYATRIQRMVRDMADETRREVEALFNEFMPGVAMDATFGSQARIRMNKLQDKFYKLFSQKAKRMAEQMVAANERAATSALAMSLKEASGGLTLKTSIVSEGLKDTILASIAENVALIKSIPDQYMLRVQGTVMRAITSGEGLKEILPLIRDAQGITERRAVNVALDQTRKAYNSINRDKMEAIGVRKFEWIHSGGGQQPREDHIEMSGNIYSLDDLPVIDQRTGERGIPGTAVNCRCVMRPIIDFSQLGETE